MTRYLNLLVSFLIACAIPINGAAITAKAAKQTAVGPVATATVTSAPITPRADDFTPPPPPTITPPSITPPDIPTVSISIHTCTQTIKPDENGYVPPGTCNSFFNYYPSFGAAIAMSILFGIVSVAHITQAAIHKKSFCWVIIMGSLWEFGSYVTRTLATKNQQSSGLVLVSQILILLAPLLVNAFDYMVLARMIHFFLPERQLPFIKPSVLAFCFVWLDFISFVIQLVGGTMASPGSRADVIQRGLSVYKAGIGLQQAFIIIFIGIAILFHVRMLRSETSRTLSSAGWTLEEGWRKLLYALYASLGLISIRIIYRFVEFSAGVHLNNPVISQEWYMYVFDATMMLLSILCWNVAHPGTVLKGPHSEPPKMNIRKKLRLKKDKSKKQGLDPIEQDPYTKMQRFDSV